MKYLKEAYYHFAKNYNWKYSIASCLTVNFAGDIHKARIDNWPKHYDWLDKDSYVYFRDRMSKVKHEKDAALNYVLEWFKTPEEQVEVLETIKFKAQKVHLRIPSFCCFFQYILIYYTLNIFLTL